MYELRTSKGLTQREMADFLGVNKATINNIETRKSFRPNKKLVTNIASVIGSDPESVMRDIIFGKDHKDVIGYDYVSRAAAHEYLSGQPEPVILFSVNGAYIYQQSKSNSNSYTVYVDGSQIVDGINEYMSSKKILSLIVCNLLDIYPIIDSIQSVSKFKIVLHNSDVLQRHLHMRFRHDFKFNPLLSNINSVLVRDDDFLY
ncbi:MAG: helix-turn-helix transcriptional regulator [Erysipelotrichaceae bacterium]|nr:helix-turn-helix transcriptional regulator [Erysipelotrichaceae bacterium]